jgi:hypothetical protein
LFSYIKCTIQGLENQWETAKYAKNTKNTKSGKNKGPDEKILSPFLVKYRDASKSKKFQITMAKIPNQKRHLFQALYYTTKRMPR